MTARELRSILFEIEDQDREITIEEITNLFNVMSIFKKNK